MQFLIMHGSYGSPEENWFRWLEKELKILGHSVVLTQFPVDNWDEVVSVGQDQISDYAPKQSLQIWDDFFIKNVLPVFKGESFAFIGHSSAPIFMLHMLQKYSFTLTGAIFVAPFFDIPNRQEIWQFYPTNKTFYNYDFNFEKIKGQIGKSWVVYGDNDPYVPASEPPLFATRLGSEVVVVEGGGHCGGIFKEFPLVLDLAKKLSL